MVDAKKDENLKKSKKNFITASRKNPWIPASIVLGILVIVFLIMSFSTGCASITKDEAGEKVTEYLNSMTGGGVTLVQTEKSGSLYEVIVLYQNQEIPVYSTLDGEYLVQGAQKMSITGNVVDETGNQEQMPDNSNIINETLLECSENNEFKKVQESTIIFLYSNSCGWCEKMKPGVTELENQGYDIYRTEISEQDEFTQSCIMPRLQSGGVPQFICVKTGEIKVGAFADNQANLDQEAMNTWAEACVSA